MEKIEICKKVTELGKEGQRTLVYFLTADTVVCDGISQKGKIDFGVGITIAESGEEVFVRGITTVEEEIKRLGDLLASNFVTPVTLKDIVEDWLCLA